MAAVVGDSCSSLIRENREWAASPAGQAAADPAFSSGFSAGFSGRPGCRCPGRHLGDPQDRPLGWEVDEVVAVEGVAAGASRAEVESCCS